MIITDPIHSSHFDPAGLDTRKPASCQIAIYTPHRLNQPAKCRQMPKIFGAYVSKFKILDPTQKPISTVNFNTTNLRFHVIHPHHFKHTNHSPPCLSIKQNTRHYFHHIASNPQNQSLKSYLSNPFEVLSLKKQWHPPRQRRSPLRRNLQLRK